MLGRRVPRLHEKVVEARLIDGADRRVGIGIGREQRAFRVWKNLLRVLQKPDTIHARHALVGKQERHTVVANLKFFENVERRFGSVAAHHAIVCAVLRTQIPLNGTQDIGIVVHAK